MGKGGGGQIYAKVHGLARCRQNSEHLRGGHGEGRRRTNLCKGAWTCTVSTEFRAPSRWAWGRAEEDKFMQRCMDLHGVDRIPSTFEVGMGKGGGGQIYAKVHGLARCRQNSEHLRGGHGEG